MKFTRPLLITKLKATSVHLCLSLAVFVYLVYQIYYNWYPQPYFEVDGGWQGIRLVAAVDLVLGPLITFLIFDLRKSRREILFDLLTIAVIQISALSYGVYATYTQRPVAIVLIDEFVFSAIPEQYGGKLKSLEDLRQYSDEHPPIIFAEMPTTEEGIAEVNRFKLEERVLEHAQLDLYRPKAKLAQALRERQLLFGDRLDYYGERDDYRAWLQQNGKSEDEVLIAPFGGRYGRVWLVFDVAGNYLSYFD
ncbi:MAG: hypothetical protein OEO19_02220 [Gammaproteobacteria bacterium]|nr:hypothetical protein [Gammaproteobacteria bacterium]MDH3450138.1 hypothetical protein [Gammaproteobacteria bacterium]